MFHELSPASNLTSILTELFSLATKENDIIDAANARKSDIYKRVRGCGLNVRAFKIALKRLRRSPEQKEQDAEQEAAVAAYMQAIGMDVDSIRSQGLTPEAVIGGRDDFPTDLTRDLSAAI